VSLSGGGSDSGSGGDAVVQGGSGVTGGDVILKPGSGSAAGDVLFRDHNNNNIVTIDNLQFTVQTGASSITASGTASFTGGQGVELTSSNNAPISIVAGYSTSTVSASGPVTVGSGDASSGASGDVTVRSGQGSGASGSIIMSTGTSSSGIAGAVNIGAGNSGNSAAGSAVSIQAGQGSSGGSVTISAGDGTGGNAGDIVLQPGSGANGGSVVFEVGSGGYFRLQKVNGDDVLHFTGSDITVDNVGIFAVESGSIAKLTGGLRIDDGAGAATISKIYSGTVAIDTAGANAIGAGDYAEFYTSVSGMQAGCHLVVTPPSMQVAENILWNAWSVADAVYIRITNMHGTSQYSVAGSQDWNFFCISA